jgi:hypothetical protein
MKLLFLIVAFVCLSNFALAETIQTDSELRTPWSLNVGALGVMAVSVPGTIDGSQVGQAMFVGPSYTLTFKHIVFIPSLTFATAPETGTWGFNLSPVLEIPFWNGCGFDLVPTISQNTHDDSTDLLWAFGPGLRITHDTGSSFGIYTQLSSSLNTDSGWTLRPTANLSIPLAL